MRVERGRIKRYTGQPLSDSSVLPSLPRLEFTTECDCGFCMECLAGDPLIEAEYARQLKKMQEDFQTDIDAMKRDDDGDNGPTG